MTTTRLFVLGLLAERPQHGYEIRKWLELCKTDLGGRLTGIHLSCAKENGRRRSCQALVLLNGPGIGSARFMLLLPKEERSYDAYCTQRGALLRDLYRLALTPSCPS
jgi:hypothetical protein